MWLYHRSIGKAFLVWIMVWMSLQALPKIFLQGTSEVYIVIERRDTWMIVRNEHGRYYAQTDIHDPYQWGDLVSLSGKIAPLAMTTYEQKFNFIQYLDQRGVQGQFHIEKIRMVFAFPIRIRAIINHRLEDLEPEIGNLVSLLLFNRSRHETQPNIIQEWFTMSGLGFYFLWSALLKLFMIRFEEKESRLILLGIFFPYLILAIGHWSFFRIYLLEALRWASKTNSMQPIKGYGLAIFSIFHPFYWLQPGGKIYLAFQVFNLFILPLFQHLKGISRWIGYSGFSLLWEWLNEGRISLLETLLFAPIAAIKIWLMPGWMVYLYFGIKIPTLTWFTKIWREILFYIPNIPKIYLGNMPFLMMIIFLMLMVIWLWFGWLKLTIHKRHVLMFSFTLITYHVSRVDQFWHHFVHFINVGQGDATLVSSQGRSLLIDTGGVKQFDIAKEVLIPYFLKQRIRQLDYLIITHDDYDHNGGVSSLIKHFRVKKIIMTSFKPFQLGRMMISNYQQYWLSLVEDNERSLMVGIEWLDCRWLVMGDATVKTEELLLNNFPDLKANILRVGHHGSNTSTSNRLLNQLDVKHAVISSGGGNRYGHPHHEVIQRLHANGIRIRRTDIEGTIRYQTCKI
jgi:competence protein ComEC